MFTMVNLMRLKCPCRARPSAPRRLQKRCNMPVSAPRAARRTPGGKHHRTCGCETHAADHALPEHGDARPVFEAASNLDIAGHGPDENERSRALQLAEFLLPVCKACGSETGFEVASLAVQVFGGHGYITESGVEQYVRDVRVAAIYEGTNGIQALDLVTRKLLRDQGARYRILAGNIESTLAETGAVDSIGEIHRRRRPDWPYWSAPRNTSCNWPGGTAARYRVYCKGLLPVNRLVAGAWMWLRIAHAGADDDRDDLFRPATAPGSMRGT